MYLYIARSYIGLHVEIYGVQFCLQKDTLSTPRFRPTPRHKLINLASD